MTGPARDAEHDSFAALRHPEFRVFLLGMFAIFLATQMQSTVLGIQVYDLARATRGVGESAWSVGLLNLAEAAPFLALTLVGGWLSDRMDRRALCIVSFLGILGAGLVLLGVNLGRASALWPFFAAQALAGVARAFFRPASVALGTELVPKEHYANAATWRSTMFHTATVAGPPLGALLYAFAGPGWAYGAMVALLVAGLGSLFLIRPRPRPQGAAGPLLKGLGEGLRFVFGHQVILSALSLDLFAVLFGGAVAMIPAFAREILHVGPMGVGVLRVAPAAGAVLMGLVLARRGMFPRAGRVLLACVALFGLTWIAFALSTSFWVSLLVLAAGGAFDNVSVVLRGTLVQTCTPPEMMGRVAAVNSFFIGSSNELGAFESGLAVRLMGLVPSVVFGGAMTLVTVGLTAWKAPQLRRLDRIR